MRSHLVASGDDAADKVRAVEGKIGRRVKRGPQLQPREQVQQELQPLGADRKLGAEIDSAAPFERKIELSTSKPSVTVIGGWRYGKSFSIHGTTPAETSPT